MWFPRHPHGPKDLLVETICALQELVDAPQHQPGLGALDHAVVVGARDRHHRSQRHARERSGRCAGELGRDGDGSRGDDQALPLHQARHTHLRAETAGVRERDVRPVEVLSAELARSAARDEFLVGLQESAEV